MLDLYHWEPNANSAKVMIGLAEKGLEFRSQYVDLLQFEQYLPGFLALNPFGQVPVLVHNGEVITESSLILEYLAEAFPAQRLAPTDPKGWYDAQAWGKYVDYNLGPSVSSIGWHQVMAPVMKNRDQNKLREAVNRIPIWERKAAWMTATGESYPEEQLANSRRKIELAVKRIEETLRRSSWLLGADYSIVDIGAFALSCTLPRLLPDVVNAKSAPKMMDWLARINARPAVRKILAMRGKAGYQDVYAPGPEHSRWG
ncbi:MAG: glutathione S-transferase family protein [Gammaproteobacteria bacterium]|nr:glutathione S-transferase family protein [Gammaproteobacteria bacterium]